jgi:hypothetical protein
MVHGPEVGMKYHVILHGRQQELFAGQPASRHQQLSNQLLQFADQVRNCKWEEFEEWYEIYKDTYMPPTKKRSRV